MAVTLFIIAATGTRTVAVTRVGRRAASVRVGHSSRMLVCNACVSKVRQNESPSLSSKTGKSIKLYDLSMRGNSSWCRCARFKSNWEKNDNSLSL